MSADVTLHRTTVRGLLSALDKIAAIPPTPRGLLHALTDRRGCIVSRDTIIEDLWGDREDGGPELAKQAISVHLHRLRRKGFNIVTHCGRGFIYAPVWAKPAKRKARKVAA